EVAAAVDHVAGGDDANQTAVALGVMDAGDGVEQKQRSAGRTGERNRAGGEDVEHAVERGAGGRIGAHAAHASAAAAKVAAVDEQILARTDCHVRCRRSSAERGDEAAYFDATAFDSHRTGAAEVALRNDVRVGADGHGRLAERGGAKGDLSADTVRGAAVERHAG